MRHTLIALVVVLFVVLSVMPGVAAAATRSGGTVVVEADETIDDDLEAFGGTVVVRGTVTGDLEAFGGTVVVEGTVDGDVQATGGTVQVLGTVGGDVSAAGGSVDVAEGAEIGGSLEAGAGSVAVDGIVRGDARLSGESVSLGDTAQIDGNLVYDGDLSQAEGAAVAGSVTQEDGLSIGPGSDFSLPTGIFAVYGALVSLLLGAVLLLAFPGTSATIAERATDSPLRTGGVGLLALVAIPIVLFVVAITVVGIPLALAGGVTFALLLWLGSVYGRFVLGTWLLSLADVENRWAALVVGVVVVALLGLIPVVDPLVTLAVFLLGFGALVAVIWERYRESRRSKRQAPPAPGVDDTGADVA